MRPGLRIGVVLAGAASLLMACQLLVGVKDEDENLRPVEAVVDASLPDSEAPACVLARPPGPPDSGEGSPANEHAFAVRTVKFEGFDDLPNAFDFDSRCSCENRDPEKSQSACVAPANPCGEPPSDDPEGRDLGGRNAFRAARPFTATLENNDINPRFVNGLTGFLVRLKAYNETPNDRTVEVSVSISNGIEKSSKSGAVRTRDEACGGRAVDGGVTPAWDGKDVWFTSTGGTGSIGHVRDGLLIVDGANTAYEIQLGGQSLKQTRSVFVARIERTPNGLKLHGNLVGLVKAADLLGVVGEFKVPFAGLTKRICEDPTTLSLFSKPICDNLDLSSEGDPASRCDSVAIAFGVDAFEIRTEPGTKVECPTVDSGVAPCPVRSCVDELTDAGDAGDARPD